MPERSPRSIKSKSPDSFSSKPPKNDRKISSGYWILTKPIDFSFHHCSLIYKSNFHLFIRIIHQKYIINNLINVNKTVFINIRKMFFLYFYVCCTIRTILFTLSNSYCTPNIAQFKCCIILSYIFVGVFGLEFILRFKFLLCALLVNPICDDCLYIIKLNCRWIYEFWFVYGSHW